MHSSKKVSGTILISILVVLIILSGCVSSEKEVKETGKSTTSIMPKSSDEAKETETASQQPNTTQTKTENPNKNIENAGVGTTYNIKYRSAEYEVTLTKTTFEKTENEYAASLNKNYLMAYFEIKNIGKGEEYFAPNLYAIDSSGEKYDRTVAGGLGDEYSKTLDFFKQLPPNTKMSGWAAIEIPENIDNVDLYFQYTNPFLDDQPQYIKYKITK